MPADDRTPAQHRRRLREPRAATASVLVAGDVCVKSGISLPGPGESLWPGLEAVVAGHDLALVNLECPLTARPAPIRKSGPTLSGEPDLAARIASGGFGAVTLANNHLLDAGPAGVLDTLQACRSAGLRTLGAGSDLSAAEEPLVTEVGGMRVAVVACCEHEFSIAGRGRPGAAPLDPWRTPQLVRRAADSADAVVVVVHGGNEGYTLPRPGLVAACRALVASGAAAVVCHHAHVACPVETFRGAPIFYGTGNFVFPGARQRGPGWLRGYLVSLELDADGVASYSLHPTVQQVSTPCAVPMGDDEAASFLRDLEVAAEVVADEQRLLAAWKDFCRSERPYYLYAVLGLSRVERKMLRLGLWPAWRRRRARIPELLGLLTCESHREAVEQILLEETQR